MNVVDYTCYTSYTMKCSSTDKSLSTALYAQFTTEVIDMPLHCVHTHDQAACYFTIGSALGQQV
jgi:hypothetical protein